MFLLHLHYVLYPFWFSIPLSIYQPLFPVEAFQNKSQKWHFALNYFDTRLPKQNCLNCPFPSSRNMHTIHVIFTSADVTFISDFAKYMLWGHGDSICIMCYLVWSQCCPISFSNWPEGAPSNRIILWESEERLQEVSICPRYATRKRPIEPRACTAEEQ